VFPAEDPDDAPTPLPTRSIWSPLAADSSSTARTVIPRKSGALEPPNCAAKNGRWSGEDSPAETEVSPWPAAE
jgi:hypothetical protein